MFRHSLAIKLVMASLAVELVMLTALLLSNISLMRASLETQTEHRVAEIDVLLNAALAVPLVSRDQGTLQDVLDGIRRREGLEYLLLADARGLVMARSGWPKEAAPPPPSAGPPGSTPDRWDTAIPITLGGQVYGRLHYGLSTTFFAAAKGKVLTVNLAIATAEILLSVLLLSAVAFVLTRRLRAVTSTTEAIAGGDLGARASISGNDDEVDRLGRSFNAMADALGARVMELSKLSRAVEQGPMSVIITDAKGTIEYVNPHFSVITGYAPEEAIGANPRFLKSGQTPAETHCRLWATITAGEVWRGFFHNRRKDGSLFWEEAAIAPVYDSTGTIAHYVGIKIDITERRTKEEELARAVDRLTQSNTELERFAYVASHDLQEPLRTVISFAQLLKRRFGGKLGEEGEECIRFVVDASNHMHELINDLLVFSRLGAGGRPLAMTSSAKACASAINNLHDSIGTEGARVTPDDLPEVVADPVQLVQLFQNLIGNAIKFRRPDVTPLVSIGAKRRGDLWEFSITDNGIGFDAGEQDIFEIFRRLHRDAYPGTGVGLAICKRIVLRHGGLIWAESTPGQGSTFRFTLPGGSDGLHGPFA